jgi:FkbM family methyltransferase
MKYDIVEIGCCTWAIDSMTSNSPCLLVEPVPKFAEYLRQIDKENWTIEQSAIVPDGVLFTTFYQYGGSETWMQGSSSFFGPNHRQIFQDQNHPADKINVNQITIRQLIDKYNIENIRYLKIDAEGMDFHILCDLFDIVELNHDLLPYQIRLEDISNSISPNEDILMKKGVALKNLHGRYEKYACEEHDLIFWKPKS